MWTFYSLAILISIIEIQHVLGTGCRIVSVTSPSASTLKVVWSSHSGATSYKLDLSVVNSTTIAPVVVMLSAPSTERVIQGLRPGHNYKVTLKVFEFMTIVCTDVTATMTVPATSQITFSKAISSTSIKFEWFNVTGADSYILFVEKLFSYPPEKYSQTFTSLGGQVDGLTPATTYNCYIYSSNSAGRGAKSSTKTIMTLVQPPTGVALVLTGKSTAKVTWNPVSKVLLYQVTVSDEDSSNAPVISNTSSTTIDISNLEPCSVYTVGVSSINVFLVPGEASNASVTTSTINPVTAISVDYRCLNSMVTVTWDLVFGANLYRATAVDGTGESLNCTSASTSCQITMLKCGEKYVVHVTALSDDCQSTSNVSAWFETVPCAPANPKITSDCSSNVVLFGWEFTNNTKYYVATAIDNNGVSTECRTVDNMCLFTNTGCGQFYKYSVLAVSSECNSETSPYEFVRTSPCLPTNVKTTANCRADTLITTWDSAAGALSYTVEVEGNTGETYNCTSSSESCAVTGVPCGEHLSVWIVASNDNCSSSKVLGEAAQTAPCTPTNVSALVDCSQDSARINWTTSIGAIFYIAIAIDTNGDSYNCNSLGSTCLMKGLKCGENYTASVIGTNLKCNSTASEEITFRTAPCPPTNIDAYRDCDANHVVIVWQKPQNHQSVGLYTATIEDQSGAQLTCSSSTHSNCKITSPPCGKKYNVTVSYSDGNCLSTSTPINMDSVPCGPEDVKVNLACTTGELTVTWNISVPAENYTTFISRGIGQPLRCNSTETECTRGGLMCGSSYSVQVFSVTGDCFSLPSAEINVQTLPCPPTNITAPHTCAPDLVPVSWVASDSAKYYTAIAMSSGGHRSECKTNQTTCFLPQLQCGEVYTIGVSGGDDNCTGLLSDTVSYLTEPCSPSNVTSKRICSNGTALVSWSPSANAVTYAVKANGNGHPISCSSPSPNCMLSDLVCGQAYTITVTALDSTCVSKYSAPFRQEQVPCAPQIASTNPLCGTDGLMVSWITAAEPLNYSVIAVPLDGNSVTCDTIHGNCSLSGLQCGQTYNVSVRASSGSCDGPYSLPQTVQSAPCSPQSLTAVAACGTDSLLASWDASVGATSYTVTVTGPNGFSETHTSPNLTHSVSGLQCANQYNVTVASHDSLCTSIPAQTVVTTGPCDPVNITSKLQCGSNTATVSWEAAAGAVAYTVLALEGISQHYASCQSTTTSCQLNQLHCGKVYNLTLMAEDATCNSTGTINTILMTGPCSPSIQNSTLICGTSSSSLSWTPVADATGYVVNATATSGHTVSCNSATTECMLTDLQCSETYMTTITAKGSQCDSAPSSSTNFTTAPCPPTITSKQSTCGTDTAVFTWTNPIGCLGFLLQLTGHGYQDTCQTTNTSCMFQNLPCGLDFNVTVQAQGLCDSIPSVSESLQTVPCAPVNVSASLVCLDHSALVSWVGSASAIGYNVTLTAQDGHTHHCQTNTTNCQLPDIHCGETYGIMVTPYSGTCAGKPSEVYNFSAGLCAPSNLTVSPACEGSIVSWSNVPGSEMFVATATADDGHTHNCSSNNSNSCKFTDLHCGETYSITVITVDRGCRSEPSSVVELRTALCPPTNLRGEDSCDTNMLTLMWDQSPVSGTLYTLQSTRMGGSYERTIHTTPNTTHTLTNLLCGQRYAFQIKAQDGNCHSSYSPPIEMSTVPCQPTNLTARVDCGTNKGNFSWAEMSAAEFYIVEVTGEHGHVASCSSNNTSCAVKLHCGRSYSATLVAATGSCNSSKHADINFDSAPCLPGDVFAELQCSTNVMNVSWAKTPGSDDYTAWAISTDGHQASCNTTANSCSIHHLLCGKVYEVVVTSSSVHCKVIAGSDYKVQSAPCKPENISIDQNCSSHVMTVKWSESSTTQNYTVKAMSASGVNSTCDSTEGSCPFLDLSCGELYTFTVMGHTNVCMSEMSSPIDKFTAPCPPTSVSAELNCTTGKALVSWRSAAAVATSYSVQATSTSGLNSSCSDIGTACYLNNLVCGQDYSVIVEAMQAGCPGPASTPTMLTTEPCTPMNLSVHYNVSTARAMWVSASGASSYFVQAVTDQGLTVTCNTTSTNCFLDGLQCSQIYNVTVMAHNQACESEISKTYHLMTAPCPPTNVQASVECEQLTVTVSWQKSDLALGYVAYLEDKNGHYMSCVGAYTDTQCVVSGLMCGTTYTIWVKALGERYNSSGSVATTLTSGPCLTGSIAALMDCEADSATISWQPSIGATSYVAELTASSGHTTSCTTNHTNCVLSSLQCGEEYNVSVTALGDTCNTTAQMAGYLTTEPCTPMNLSVHYNVSTAQVMWGASSGASSYFVQAVTDQGLTVTCNTSGTNCFLDGLQCSQIYNVTVMAHNQACNSSVTPEPYRLRTAPCPPTNIQASMECEQLTASVSWQQSDLADGYVAYLNDQTGLFKSCVATDADTFCVLSGLMCGTVYSVWVKALGEHYNSSSSRVVSLTSAPCLPKDIEVEVDCNSDGAAVMSWTATNGSANFSVTVIVSGSLQTLCSTQQNSCNVTGLSCGETYNLSLTASNMQCSLTAPMHTNLTTRPCPPQRVAVDLQCGSRTAVLSWEERSDVELYKASAVPTSGGTEQKCNSTGSTCQFPGLDCGETYNLTVTAYSQGCSSQASNPVLIQTEPCQPVILLVQSVCNSTEVQLSWQLASGAVNYLVTAMGNLGYVETYNITQTRLSAALPCGQDYNVTVQGQGSDCDSLPSSPAIFKTTPCVPRDVTTYVECEFSMGSVSWGPSDGAEKYVVVATGLDGHTHHCLTNTTSCTWDDLHCGEEYTVVVRARDKNCTSPPSNSSVIHMAPCLPQNLSASVNCDMKVVSLRWDASEGAKSYVVSAEAGHRSRLTTNVTTAHFSDLSCGQTYTLTVTPKNQHCLGNRSAPASVQTWPCPPAGVSAIQDCLSGIVMVTWQGSNGSDYYTATMQTDSGISSMCMSQSTKCSVPGLTCGHNFSVSVTASNQQCNITSSETTSLQSVPCVPTDVAVTMDCANNTALVSWSASQGAVQYLVTAHSIHGNVSCQTSDVTCSLDNLTCGSNYTVQVVAMDDDCSSIPIPGLTFNSAPCPPQNVSAEVGCLSSDMRINWDTSREADHFLVSVIAVNGTISGSCNTTNTACSISPVTCGNTFTVQVTSIKGTCHSQHSRTKGILSAPCQPQGINGALDCVTNSAWISWDAAPGADSYTVSAVGEEDYTANCTTFTNTTCEVEDLACGVLYNFSVTAKNSKCESQPSDMIELQTAPCTLTGISAVAQCHISSILVKWDLMEGSEGSIVYNATAEAKDQTYLSCNSTGTSCYLYGARCDLHYTIMVAASSDQCSSMRSPPYRISMEPCPPANVVVKSSCEDHSALVSWSPSPVAETYHVVAIGIDGHVHTCNTTFSNCSVSELHCDQQYTVYVTASHENCSSKASENTTITTGPCQPGGVKVIYHCNNQSALLSWTHSDSAIHYYGCAQAGNGDMLYCHSSTSTCTIQGLECGTAYNFSVQASDGTCNSSFSDPVQTEAVPCPPDTVEVHLMPMEMEIQNLHFSWTQVPCNNTMYLLHLTGNLLGDNNTQFELSSYWTSMTYYEIPLPCSSDYIATVVSRNAAGISDPSVPLHGRTAPCQPSGLMYSGNSSFATVSWNASVFATTYTVYDNSVTPKSQICSTAGLSCSLFNITSTDLVITAMNSAGESQERDIAVVATLQRRRRDVGDQMLDTGDLSAPVLDVTHVMSTFVALEWSEVPAASYYSMLIRKQGTSSETQELIVYGEAIILTELSQDTTYCISVTARTSVAGGPESEPVCVQLGH